jgi:UDP-N-acetylmuramoylalanine--D-glutamate ligase
VVVETSSFQLEGTRSFRPFAGVLLNAAPDHLEHHHTFENYLSAKARMFASQTAEDHAVLGVDDPNVAGLAERVAAQTHTFATDVPASGAYLEGEALCVEGIGPVIDAREIGAPGRHNVRNAMAAAVVGHLAGASVEAMQAALREARPPEHAQELVAEIGGVRYINDTKATNPAAAMAALEAVTGPVIAIVGGSEKDADFGELGRRLAERAKLVLTIGDCGPRLADVTRAAGGEAVEAAGSLEEAVGMAAKAARPGDTVVLAPACASFDMFDDYAHRGRVFRELVRGLETE